MKNKVIILHLFLIIISVIPLQIDAQQNGDFRTKQSGNWKSKSTWEVYQNGSWQNTNQTPGNDINSTVTIQSDHEVVYDKNKSKTGDLIVDAGGKLYRNSQSTENELEIYGDILCNGTIGNGSTPDALTLAVNGEFMNISGDGECKFYRITKTDNTWLSAQLTIGMTVELTLPSGISVVNTKNNTNLEIRVNPGASLTSHATIDLNNGNSNKTCSIYLRSDDTGYGSLITGDIEDSDASNTTVERFLNQNEWHYISSPVEAPAASVFYDIYLMQFSEPDGSWSYITDPSEILEQEMQGFAAWTSSGLLGNTVLEFKGKLNTGIKSIDLTYTDDPTHNNKGFNFVGNPYASAIDWDYNGPEGWQKSNVDNAIYQWNGDMGVYGSYVNGYSVNEATNIIPALQGFYVHCNQPQGTLSVGQGAQVHDPKPFFKSGNDENVLRLKSTGNDLSDECLIRFDESASTDFDPETDALKIMGAEEAPQIYSFSGSELLSINSLPEIMVIGIGFQCSEPGIYSICWEGVQNFVNTNEFYLEDLKTHEMIDMTQFKKYDFSHQVNEAPHRFDIHFGKPNGINNDREVSNINIYAFQGTVHVKTQDNGAKIVRAYDLTGRELNELRMTGNQISFSPGRHGYIMIRVDSVNYTATRKVFLN